MKNIVIPYPRHENIFQTWTNDSKDQKMYCTSWLLITNKMWCDVNIKSWMSIKFQYDIPPPHRLQRAVRECRSHKVIHFLIRSWVSVWRVCSSSPLVTPTQHSQGHGQLDKTQRICWAAAITDKYTTASVVTLGRKKVLDSSIKNENCHCPSTSITVCFHGN